MRIPAAVILLSLFLLSLNNTSGQDSRVTLVINDVTGEFVSDASVQVNQKKYFSDSLGKVEVWLPNNRYIISVSAINHYPTTLNINLNSDTTLMVSLRLRESLLGNVTVVSSRNVVRNQMGIQSITAGELRRLPVVLGEVDPLKTITLLPGVKTGGEASSGIYVRGGGPDQNLVLLDGIPVYNPNHLLGFFSIFNGEAIKGIEVIKGGIPAEYGGRLSSVISIDTREGNKDSIKGSGGIGLISSRLSVEGPIIKGKSSFVVSARRTYIDALAKLVARSKVGDNGYYFYDINAKADYVLNANNQFYFTFYRGLDDFTYINNENNRNRSFNTYWGNTIAGLTWKQQITKKLKQETSVVYNSFDLDSKIAFSTVGFVFSSALSDKALKTDWLYTSNKWLKLRFGANYTWHRFTPGAGGATSGVQEFKTNIKDQYAREGAAYLSADINITPKLNMIAGLRYSIFSQVGPTEKVVYDADGVPTGEVKKYGKGEKIASYANPEPRVSVLYRLPGQSSIKASYTNTIQYLHLATTSGATFPGDLWIPSSSYLKPARADQYALGYFKNFNNNTYEFSVEAYYKTMDNQLEFKPGAQLLLNQNLDGEMIFGSGKAYGVEFFLQKRRGKLTGWLGYTLSRTERTFPDLNNGKTFPYRYDRTHDLSVVANYSLSRKWEASAVFVYGTGNALTMPTGRFTYNLGYNGDDESVILTNINQYDQVNDYRMPAYHRLDVAFTYTPKPNSTKRYRSSWNFSIYNLYSRANPYFIYLDANEEELTIKGKKVYLFPILPSVTWNFKF